MAGADSTLVRIIVVIGFVVAAGLLSSVLTRFRKIRRAGFIRCAATKGFSLYEEPPLAANVFLETTSFSAIRAPYFLAKGAIVIFDCSVRLVGGRVAFEVTQTVFSVKIQSEDNRSIICMLHNAPDRFVDRKRFRLCSDNPSSSPNVSVFTRDGSLPRNPFYSEIASICEHEGVNVVIDNGCIFVYAPSKIVREDEFDEYIDLVKRLRDL